jgi:hypothetical protein
MQTHVHTSHIGVRPVRPMILDAHRSLAIPLYNLTLGRDHFIARRPAVRAGRTEPGPD